MKKFLSIILSALMVFSLVACGTKTNTATNAPEVTQNDGAETPAPTNEKKKVCFVARASADTFAAWLTSEMKKNAAKYSDVFDLTCVSGEADDNRENNLLEDCITKQYDLVIVQSNNNSAQAPSVQKLLDAGIPVITTNPTTHEDDAHGNGDNSVMKGTGTVDADPVAQAAVGAKRAVNEIPENANVVVLKGPSGNFHADKRREGWDTYFFSQRPDVTILGEDFANWNSDEALTLMEAWTQKGTHIDAIISMNDNMAAGAIEAIRNNEEYVKEDGTTTFLAYGVDGTAQGCLLIREGLLTATALQSAAELAAKNMDYAAKVCKGEMAVTDVNDYVDAPEINKDNVQDYIQIYLDNGELKQSDLK